MTVKCPFCKEGEIKISRTPDVYTSQTIRVGSNRKTIPKLVSGKSEVISDKCPICNKPKAELQKAISEGIKPSAAEMAKRAQNSGLPTRF
jgi:hypothetical protein